MRDEQGNARGGIRTPPVDVPAATLSGDPVGEEILFQLFGSTTTFEPAPTARSSTATAPATWPPSTRRWTRPSPPDGCYPRTAMRWPPRPATSTSAEPNTKERQCPTQWTSSTSRPSAWSPRRCADALAGLRANEARYFKNKYDHVFTVEPAAEAADDHRLGAAASSRRSATSSIASPPLEATELPGRGHPLGLRLLRERPVDQRALHRSTTPGSAPSGSSSPTGWRSPTELASRFKFARQKSKLAGTIRGSYFVDQRASTDATSLSSRSEWRLGADRLRRPEPAG